MVAQLLYFVVKELFIVTLDDIISEMREKASGFDASTYSGFLALQITLKDLGQPLYVEVKDGKLSIEPYEYADRQAHMIISSANFMKMINGKLNSVLAFTTGKLKIEGDIEKAKELKQLFV